MHFAIFIIWFRIFSPFYIYLTLPYPHKKNRREIPSPPSSGTTATSLRLCFHCDCVLHLVLRLLAIDLRPIIAFSIEFSIEFLSHHYRISIASHCAPRIIASHVETVYWKGLPRPRTFYIDLSVVFVLIIFRSYRHCGHITDTQPHSLPQIGT